MRVSELQPFEDPALQVDDVVDVDLPPVLQLQREFLVQPRSLRSSSAFSASPSSIWRSTCRAARVMDSPKPVSAANGANWAARSSADMRGRVVGVGCGRSSMSS